MAHGEKTKKAEFRKLILASTLILSGCAYNGDVYLYSPSGAGNAIEKSVDADLDVPLLP